MRKIIAIGLLGTVLSGCAGTNFTYDDARRVQVGMTEEQVLEIMGSPYSVISRPNGQLWVWSHANMLFGGTRAISYLIRDGVVVQVPSIPQTFK